MKIIYQPQLSMRSYNTDTMITNGDAQWTKAKGAITKILEKNEVILLLPNNAELPRGIEKISFEYTGTTGNVMRHRYHFDTERMLHILEKHKPDVIWTEFPELVANIKAITDIPILCTFEHYDDKYIVRQIEGFMLSDRCIFPTEELYRLNIDEFYNVFNGRKLSSKVDNNRISIWNNFVCKEELDGLEKIVSDKISTEYPKRLLFPSRLSDNSRTRWDLLENNISRIIDLGFTIEICNPTEISKPEIIDKFPDTRIIFHEKRMTRREWLIAATLSDVSIIFYSFDDFYSVGAMELLSLGSKLVTMKSNFLEKIMEKNPGTIYFLNKDYSDVIDKIHIASKTKVNPLFRKIIMEEYSGEKWSEKILEDLQNVVSKKNDSNLQ